MKNDLCKKIKLPKIELTREGKEPIVLNDLWLYKEIYDDIFGEEGFNEERFYEIIEKGFRLEQENPDFKVCLLESDYGLIAISKNEPK